MPTRWMKVYIVPDYLQGKIKVDEYVTHHRKFEEINEGFHDMHVCPRTPWRTPSSFSPTSQGGDCIRCVVDMS